MCHSLCPQLFLQSLPWPLDHPSQIFPTDTMYAQILSMHLVF